MKKKCMQSQHVSSPTQNAFCRWVGSDFQSSAVSDCVLWPRGPCQGRCNVMSPELLQVFQSQVSIQKTTNQVFKSCESFAAVGTSHLKPHLCNTFKHNTSYLSVGLILVRQTRQREIKSKKVCWIKTDPVKWNFGAFLKTYTTMNKVARPHHSSVVTTVL